MMSLERYWIHMYMNIKYDHMADVRPLNMSSRVGQRGQLGLYYQGSAVLAVL